MNALSLLNRRHGRLAAIVLVLVAAIVLVTFGGLRPGSASATPTGSISGVVTGAEAPAVGLANIGVQLTLPGGTYVQFQSTDSGGHYSFTGLPGTSYVVHFYGDADTDHLDATSSTIVLADGQAQAGVDAVLPLGGTVSGTISTSTGPLTHAASVGIVKAGANVTRPGDLFLISTAADGSFSFTGVATGSYTLYFAGGFGQNLAPQYWSGAASLSTATFFTVTAGQTVSGRNAVLQPGASISGTVTGGAANSPLAGAFVQALDAQGAVIANGMSGADGAYTILGLAAGSVTLEFGVGFQNYLTQWWSGASSQGSAQYFAVPAGSAVTGRDAHLVSGATISGTITDSLTNPIAFALADAFAADGTQVGSGLTNSSGVFTIPALTAGDYTVKFDGGGTGHGSRWWNNAESASNATVIHLAVQQQLTGISGSLATVGAIISGTITGLTADGVEFPAHNAEITVFAADGSIAGTDTADVSGQYTVPDLAAGSYLVEVSPQGDTTDFKTTWYAHASSQASATSVVVTTGQSLSGIDVQLPSSRVSAPGAFGSVAPSRLLDTRSGLGAPTGAVAPLGVVALQVAGRGGVPASGVSAVVLNVTVAGSTSSGFVTAWADGADRPLVSNLNFLPGQIVPNLVVVPVGADGKVDLYNGSPGSTQLLADVAGYYLNG